jgi:RNAse (barnase) inhibitor barstar
VIDLVRVAAGAYRLPKTETSQEARHAALGSGWRYLELPGEEIVSKASFMAACAETFEFPRWFGANWDALSDSLCDLSWLEFAPGMLVLYDNADCLAEADPASFATAIEILRQACAWWEGRGVPMVVLVRGAPRSSRLLRIKRS